ncbi:hypothetical protein UP10_33465 [Bradyrhizobium sp. LTSPM299]|nr:hypothetical protein UP10_33465 [Bradyrhizobium sp. LTSPM299]
MRAQRIAGHQLLSDRLCQSTVQTALDVNVGQLPGFSGGVFAELLAFARDIRRLRVGLRTHRDILPRCHGHRAGDKPRDACNQHALMRAMRVRDADDEAGSGKDSVIRSQHRCP